MYTHMYSLIHTYTHPLHPHTHELLSSTAKRQSVQRECIGLAKMKVEQFRRTLSQPCRKDLCGHCASHMLGLWISFHFSCRCIFRCISAFICVSYSDYVCVFDRWSLCLSITFVKSTISPTPSWRRVQTIPVWFSVAVVLSGCPRVLLLRKRLK